ncbi:MAG: peptide chain release factor 1 [Planctomycetota bacterium]
MFERLDKMSARYEELAKLLADPAVIQGDPNYKNYLREHGILKRLVERYRRFRDVLRRKMETEALLVDPAGDKDIQALAREEMAVLVVEEEELLLELEGALLTEDAHAGRGIILEVRAGTGGDEASLFAYDLVRMYIRYAEHQGWKTEMLDSSASDVKGLKEAVLSIVGDGVYRRLRFESGGHRVQRVPATEAAGRIHTSLATVAVLPEIEEVEIDIKPEDIRVETCRAGGAGGQLVNKTESAIRIVHLATNLVVQCQNERSQRQNREQAMRILRSRLYDLEQGKVKAVREAERRNKIGSGDRNGRIRTYNFPQGRVTDHRINVTLYNLEVFMDGALDPLLTALEKAERELRLKGMNNP